MKVKMKIAQFVGIQYLLSKTDCVHCVKTGSMNLEKVMYFRYSDVVTVLKVYYVNKISLSIFVRTSQII